jgi:hypothetical protein
MERPLSRYLSVCLSRAAPPEYNGKIEIRNSLLNVVLYDKPQIRKHDASEGPR